MRKGRNSRSLIEKAKKKQQKPWASSKAMEDHKMDT